MSERVSLITQQDIVKKMRAMEGFIDPGILRLVALLNCAGINTLASCEGHLDHGDSRPWVQIANENAINEFFQIERRGKRYSENDDARWEEMNLRQKIMLNNWISTYPNNGLYRVGLIPMVACFSLTITNGRFSSPLERKDLLKKRQSMDGFRIHLETLVVR